MLMTQPQMKWRVASGEDWTGSSDLLAQCQFTRLNDRQQSEITSIREDNNKFYLKQLITSYKFNHISSHSNLVFKWRLTACWSRNQHVAVYKCTRSTVRLKSKSGRKMSQRQDIWQNDPWVSGINVQKVRNSEKWSFLRYPGSKI